MTFRHGSQLDPPNPYRRFEALPDPEHWEWDDEHRRETARRPIRYHADQAKSLVVENESPDIPFRYSVNPYRGCAHGCSYCYARNSHEYLGLNAGLDFETEIFVKHDAPRLLREFLARPGWRPEPIIFSGVTDCYQPAEREYRLTRGCLAVARDCGLPISVITKNALVVRDLDLLADMAARGLAEVSLSITTLDVELSRVMEPRTSLPAARLRAVRHLTQAGIPVRVMVAPLIPGLNDHTMGEVLAAAREAGAIDARYILLRLPKTVEPVFREWLSRTQPTKTDGVERLIRQTRGDAMYASQWGERMRGTGPRAEQIGGLFGVLRQKHGYRNLPPLDVSRFIPPVTDGQLRLF